MLAALTSTTAHPRLSSTDPKRPSRNISRPCFLTITTATALSTDRPFPPTKPARKVWGQIANRRPHPSLKPIDDACSLNRSSPLVQPSLPIAPVDQLQQRIRAVRVRPHRHDPLDDGRVEESEVPAFLPRIHEDGELVVRAETRFEGWGRVRGVLDGGEAVAVVVILADGDAALLRCSAEVVDVAVQRAGVREARDACGLSSI